MSRVLLLGTGPLPIYEGDRLYAFGVRTWHFARCLLEAGHDTRLVTFEFGGRTPPPHAVERVPKELRHQLLPEPSENNLPELIERVNRIYDEFQPEAIVTAGSNLPARVGVLSRFKGPFWIDLFGDMLTEVQAKLAFAPASEFDFFLRLHLGFLLRGDRFSAVSEAQKDEVIGQLSLAGRLTGSARDYDFVEVIPVSCDERASIISTDSKTLRGATIPADAFLVLWSGGFNTWVDVQTLFKGLELAMAIHPNLHFAASGGSITGHHEAGFAEFKALVESSSLRERFHILGWLPNEAIPALYAESDLGINVDLDIYEARLGSRCRIVNWMQAGLPCLTTRATELSRILEANRLGFVFPPGNASKMAETLLYLADHREELREAGIRAKEYVREHFSFSATISPLLEWLKNPTPAPDRPRADDPSAIRRTLWDLAFPRPIEPEEPTLSLRQRVMRVLTGQ